MMTKQKTLTKMVETVKGTVTREVTIHLVCLSLKEWIPMKMRVREVKIAGTIIGTKE